jgi:hypothetical protein
MSDDYDIDDVGFHFAVLHGLAAAGCTQFDSSRPFLDQAYETVVIARMNELGAPVVKWRDFGTDPMLFGKDPMFGTWRAAEEMILWGMQGCLLSLLSPGLKSALLHFGQRDAERELRKEKYGGPETVEWFLETGRRFKIALRA